MFLGVFSASKLSGFSFFFHPRFTHEHMASKREQLPRPNPAGGSRVRGQGSERRGLSAGDSPHPPSQVYTSVKRVHSVRLHGQSFTKVHCVGPIQPPNTHTHTPPPSAMPTLDTDNVCVCVCGVGCFWSAEPQTC